jgi:PAS domain S-box-containing protein
MDVKDTPIPLNRRWGGIFVLFCVLLVLIDIIRLFVLPRSYWPVFTDAFETVVALVGAMACGFAAARSSMLTRGLWVLTAAYLALLALADFHDLCVGIHFGEATLLSALEFVGWCTYVPLALLVFFPLWEEGQLRWKWLPVFDFAQVAITVALAYFRLIYLPHLHSGQGWAQYGTAELVRNLLISVGLLVRAAAEPRVRTRRFYQSIGGAFATITLLKIIFPPFYQPVIIIVRPAALLAIGIFATYWNDLVDNEVDVTQRPIGLRLALSLFAAATLMLVVLLAIGAPAQYRGGMYLILAASAMLFIARSYLAERTRYATEYQLRNSEREYRVLFESAIVPILIIQPRDERILQANPAACELYDVHREDLIGTSFRDFTKDVVRREEQMAELLRTGVCHAFQTVHRTRSGRYIDVLVSASLIQYRGQTAIMSFNRDITEHRRAEEALTKSRRLLAETEEIGKVGGWEVDLDAMKLTWTPEIYSIHEVDLTFEPTVDKAIQFYTPASRPVIERLVRRATEHGEPYDAELEIITAKGNLRSVRGIGRVDLEQRRVYGFFQDITTRKQNEREMAQLRLDLTHLSRVLTLNEISGSLAHEINQPLCAILNNAEVARTLLSREQDKQEDIPEILGDIIQDAKRAGDVVSKLRRLVKKGDEPFELLPINALIDDVLALLHSSLAMYKVTLRLDLKPDLPNISGDRVRLQQVMLNLVTNALDSMKETPSRILTVRSAMAAQDIITVSVSDSGPGIPEARRASLFKPFFTTKKDGLGLGLSICRSIIEEHGGRIWEDDDPGGGATFSFSLNAWCKESA